MSTWRSILKTIFTSDYLLQIHIISVLHFALSLPSYIALSLPLALILSDLAGVHSLYRLFLHRLHGFLFWHVTALVGRADMTTAAGLREHWMAPGFSHFWVAEMNGKVVGCVACRLQHTLTHPTREQMNASHRTDEASVWRLAVDPTLRKAGVGRLLMAKAEGWAGEEGARHLTLLTGNKASALFYRRIGYAIETRQRCEAFSYRGGWWPPRWVMDRVISSRTHPENGTLFMKKLTSSS